MKHIITLTLLVFLALPAYAWEARVVSVTDGDTLTVIDGSETKHRIRLWGIDAPEKDQPGGAESTQHLVAVALWQTVDVQTKAYDKYARLLAVLVRKEGWTINGNMVRMGHAWAKGSKRWKATEARARNERRGLWRGEEVIPPWEWRHRDK